MALVNPQIALSVRPTVEYQPRNALADYAQLQSIMGNQRQAELADYQLEAAKRAERSTAIQNELYARHFDPETGGINAAAFATEAAQRGQGSILPGFFKTEAERQAAAATLAKTRAETEASRFALQQKKFKQAWENAGAADTPQQAIDQLTRAVQAGELDMASASREINQLQNMPPEQYKQWRVQKISQFLEAKDRLTRLEPKYTRVDRGGVITTYQDNPNLPGYGLPVAGMQDVAKTATIGETTAQGQLALSRDRLAFDQQKAAWEQANPGNTIQQLDDGRLVAINNRTGAATPVTMGELNATVRGSTVAERRLAFDQQKFEWEKLNPGSTIQQLDDGRLVAINSRTGVARLVTMGELAAAAPAAAPAAGQTNVLAPAADAGTNALAAPAAGAGTALRGRDTTTPPNIRAMTALGIPLTREGLKEYAALSKPPSDFEMAIAGYSEAEKRRLRGLYVQNQTIGVQRLAFDQQKFAWERANPGFELRENADGTVYGVNKRTLQAVPVTIGGAAPAPNPVAPGAAAPGAAANAARTAGAPAPAAPAAAAPGTPLRGKGTALTETQSNAVAFGMRMVDADAIIKKLESSGVTSGGRTRGFVEGALTSLVPYQGERLAEGAGAVMNVLPGALGGPSPEQQQYAQAKLNFITAILRKESGAAISPAEFANEDKKYFPQAGEGPAVVEQKRRARELAIRAMRVQAGPGGRDIGGGGADDPLGIR